MEWIKIRIKTTTEAEDIIISALYDLGLDGAEIEDKQPLTCQDKEQMFVDVMPDEPFDDGIAYLNFFIEVCPQDKLNALLKEIEAVLDELRELGKTAGFINIGEGSISVSRTNDLDWSNNWKQYFHQFTIDDILITPSWEKISGQEAYKYLMRIDPGAAFGTGKHETTQLCIRQLRKYVKPGDFLLDIGCGSGILSILSLMFGAKQAYGTDLDPNALEVSRENCDTNSIPAGQLKVVIGNIITDENIIEAIGGEESFDIVVSNIITEVLVPLTPAAYRCIKKGGLFIVSGIYNTNGADNSVQTNVDKVVTAMNTAGLEIVEINNQGEWFGITARK
ncbi:MAG: 50S ribosomal protein L11 methyltransferase [Lachnospiraceae bacterium]|nr:50S ribosomal protein L11 methyltransferase [Lachnospiraceae bacterium]